MHLQKLEDVFSVRPRVFRNTELIYNNDLAWHVSSMTNRDGSKRWKGMLCEGVDRHLGFRSPNFVYTPPGKPVGEGNKPFALLLKNYKLSDDIAFRFSNRGWSEWPLSADRFAQWVHALPPEDSLLGLFMDYETFGEHQWRETGIFKFMEYLPGALLRSDRVRFETPREVVAYQDAVARLDVPYPVSWADAERDLTAWLGNQMQRAAHGALYSILPDVRKAAQAGRVEFLEHWRKLSTSDHVYYMCTKWFSDGDVHKYFSPYASPHDAFITFMNVLDDLARRACAAAGASASATTPEPFAASKASLAEDDGQP